MVEHEKKIKNLLGEMDKEFQRLEPTQQVKVAIEQINMWQSRLNEVKSKIPEEDSMEKEFEFGRINLRYF